MENLGLRDVTANYAPRIFEVLSQAKLLAREYYALTNKPLGITGEVAEYEAARHLGVLLSHARTAGYDAIDMTSGQRLQIKGRVVLPNSKQRPATGLHRHP